MLDINKRVRCEGITVAEMIEALQRLPQDGIVHFEGKKKGYIHCDPESRTIDFDTDELVQKALEDSSEKLQSLPGSPQNFRKEGTV